jgi:hypothetical protein
MEHPGFCFPAIRILGHIYRVRLRINGWRGYRRRVEHFPRRTVHSLRAGWLSVAAVVNPA